MPMPSPAEVRFYDTMYVLDHFLGRGTTNFFFRGLRERRRQKMLTRLRREPGQRRPIDRVRDISPAEFSHRYFKKGVPLVFEGAATQWPCMKKWTLEFFQQQHGAETIMVLPSARTMNGFEGTREDEETELKSFGELIENMKGDDARYIRFSTIIEDRPELLADLEFPWISERFGPASIGHRAYTFIGPKDSRTRLHADFPPNLFVQIQGKKHWILYPPKSRAIIDPLLERSALSYTTNLQVRPPLEPEDSISHHMDCYETELQPGDILFNPPYMWHDVLNITDSIGASVRWLSPGIHYRASWVMQILDLFGINPPIWRGGLTKRDINDNILEAKTNAKSDPNYIG